MANQHAKGSPQDRGRTPQRGDRARFDPDDPAQTKRHAPTADGPLMRPDEVIEESEMEQLERGDGPDA